MDTGCTILVVNDIPKIRDDICDYLRANEFEPIDFFSESDAMDNLLARKPGIALIDLCVDGDFGLELLREIREISPNTACLISTSNPGSPNVITATKLGAMGYLVKPFHLEQLLSMVRLTQQYQKTNQQLSRKSMQLGLTQRITELGFLDWHIRAGKAECDPAWGMIFDYSKSEPDWCIRAWENSIHPEDFEWVMNELNQHLAGKSDIFMAEYRLQLPNETIRRVQTCGKVTERNANSRPVKAILASRDISNATKLNDAALTREWVDLDALCLHDRFDNVVQEYA